MEVFAVRPEERFQGLVPTDPQPVLLGNPLDI
jgi:hypothetical protein